MNPLDKLPGGDTRKMLRKRTLKEKMYGPQKTRPGALPSLRQTEWQAMEAFFEPIELSTSVSPKKWGYGNPARPMSSRRRKKIIKKISVDGRVRPLPPQKLLEQLGFPDKNAVRRAIKRK